MIDDRELNKVATDIEKFVLKKLKGLKYTELDFEFYGMRVIDALNYDEETKRKILKRFHFKVKQHSFLTDGDLNSLADILLEELDEMDEEFKEEEKEEEISEGLKQLTLDLMEEKEKKEEEYIEMMEQLKKIGYKLVEDTTEDKNLEISAEIEEIDSEYDDIIFDDDEPSDCPFWLNRCLSFLP